MHLGFSSLCLLFYISVLHIWFLDEIPCQAVVEKLSLALHPLHIHREHLIQADKVHRRVEWPLHLGVPRMLSGGPQCRLSL